MSNTGNLLDQAIEHAQKAIDEDVKHNYPEAYKCYKNALDYFMLALKFEKDEKSKSLINAKIQEYLGRAETLKEHLMTEKCGKSATHRVSSTSNLDRAIEHAQKAIDEDVKQNYPEADKCYKNALDYFILALKYEKNEKSKSLINAKIQEYLGRVETLKKYLMTEERGNSTIGVNGSGGAAGPTGKLPEAEENDQNPEKKKLRAGFAGAISSETPNVNLDDVAGLEGANAPLSEAGDSTHRISSNSNLDRAIELAQKAINEDVKQNYPEAYKCYKNALDYFILALKYEKNEKSKSLMRSKIKEYLGRAETLKYLMTEKRGLSASVVCLTGKSENGEEDDQDPETKKPRAG